MAITESRIKAIEDRLDELQKSFIQTAQNQVPITAKTDDNAVKLAQITPYTETKTAYYGEKEKIFYGVPSGNISVNFNNYTNDYTITKVVDRVTVSFGALEQKTDITISII